MKQSTLEGRWHLSLMWLPKNGDKNQIVLNINYAKNRPPLINYKIKIASDKTYTKEK